MNIIHCAIIVYDDSVNADFKEERNKPMEMLNFNLGDNREYKNEFSIMSMNRIYDFANMAVFE